jgi:hypothetical protein
MNIDSRSIQRVESLKPLLRFVSDFMDTVIADDAADIMVFSTPTHPSPFHHNQWGVLLKMAAEAGMLVTDMVKKMLEREDRENFELRKISQLVQELAAERRDNADQERIFKEQRMIFVKMYRDSLRQQQSFQQPNEIIYGGNLNNIRVRPTRALPDRIEPPRVPKPKLKT